MVKKEAYEEKSFEDTFEDLDQDEIFDGLEAVKEE